MSAKSKTVGKWQKGQTGNPAGRPKDVRSITVLKNDLELAVREKLTATKVTQIVNRMVDMAINSPDEKIAIMAGKTILDMAVSKAAVQEAVAQRAPITIVIENATLAAQQIEQKRAEPTKVKYEIIESTTVDAPDGTRK